MTNQIKTDKQKYRLLCETEPSIPIFSKAWWLDSVAGDSWDVVLVEKADQIVASLPFVVKKRYGFTKLVMPQLTQTLGPWLKPSTAKYAKQLAQEKDLIQELFDKLPSHAMYAQNWHYSKTNWLPLYWKGYSQTTRYTYRINDLTDMDKVWSALDNNVRGHVNRAKKELTVVRDLPFENFIELNKKVFKRQSIPVPYSDDLLYKIDAACKSNNSSTCFYSVDEKNQIHAALYLIWDDASSYSLMSGSDAVLRSSGAISLLRWEAIKFSATVTKSFDFEGSMIEPIERFMRSFGGFQTPYFAISKTNSKMLKAYQALRNILK